MLPPGTLLQKRYFVKNSVGQGGMGAVHLAIDQRLGSDVALKATTGNTDARLRAAFEREARLLASLHHPALPSVMDYFIENDMQFLVMEYIPGEDLAEMLVRRGGAFPPGEVLGWADQLLDALDYLHTQESPIIHRDIKPANLKLTTRGQIILLDFGLAKDTIGQKITPATSKTVLGYSLNYAPLEQLQGQGTGPRSDLYSLGATLYQLMTGAPPVDVLTRLANGPPDPLPPAHELNPAVPPAVAVVLHHAMAIKREHRPSSAADMRMALRDAKAAFRQSVTQSPLPSVAKPRTDEPGLPSTPSSSDARDVSVPELEPTGPLYEPPTETFGPADVPVLPSGKQNSQRDTNPPKEQSAQVYKTIPSLRSGPATVPNARLEKKRARILWPALGALLVLIVSVIALWRPTLAPQTAGPVTSESTPTPSLSAGPSLASSPTTLAAPSAVALPPLSARHEVIQVAASSDGGMVAIATEDNKVLLWRVSDSGLPMELKGHTQHARSVAISPDDQIVASGSDDGTIRLWQSGDGRIKETLTDATKQVFIVGFGPDGHTLVSASGDKMVRVVNLSENKSLLAQTFDPGNTIVATSPDPLVVALNGRDKEMRLVLFKDKSLVASTEGHNRRVTCIGSFTADGKLLALGTEDGVVRLWRVRDGKLFNEHEQSGPSGDVGSVAFSPDGRMVAAGWGDGSIRLWRVSDARSIRILEEGHEKIVNSLSFSADGLVLVSGSDDKTVRRWQIKE